MTSMLQQGDFANQISATIHTDNFNVSLFGDGGYFSNRNSANISANDFNVNLFGDGGYFENL